MYQQLIHAFALQQYMVLKSKDTLQIVSGRIEPIMERSLQQ